MQSPTEYRTTLIRSLLDYANGSEPDIDSPFKWAVDDSAKAVQSGKLDRVRAALAAARPVSPKMTPEIHHQKVRVWLFMLQLSRKLGACVEDDEEVAALVESVLSMMRRKLVPALQGGATVKKFSLRGDHLVQVDIPIWTSGYACCAHALALLLEDSDGLRARLQVCRYSPGPAFWALQESVIEQAKTTEQICADPAVHFHIDDRFEKGTQKMFCCPEHRNATNQRKYRKRLDKDKE
jgi:hypothetical protein